MELKYDSGKCYVRYSFESLKVVKKTEIIINGISHVLELRDFEKVGFELSIKSPKTSYYLQVDDSKMFEGIGEKKKGRTCYICSSEDISVKQKSADEVLNTSRSSLFRLFEDTFFTNKNYSTFEFLVEDTEREKGYSWPPKMYFRSASAKRKKMNELDILYLRIDVKPPNVLNHLVKDISYFFTFLSMPNINTSQLPDEIFLQIFQFLPIKFLLVQVNVVCTRFHNLISSEFMSKVIYLRMFPGKAEKPNPNATWKQNIHEKYCKSIRWEYLLPSHHKPCWPATDYFDRVDGSPTHAKLGELLEDGDMVYWTNKYVSPANSHEWKVRLKIIERGMCYGGILIGVKKEAWKINSQDVMPDWEPGMYRHFEQNVVALDLGSGIIKHNGDYVKFTPGGFEREYYGEYDRRECEDFELFGDGGIVKVTLSEGKLEFEFGREKVMKKVSCMVDMKTRYCLCVRCKGLEAEIVSFRRM